MMKAIANIASFESMGLVDGPGVRFVVFLQGCPLRCAYCHNPEMWNFNEKKQQYSAEEVFAKIKRYVPYFGKDGGVTVSGGEPLMQQQFVEELFALCKQNGIHTCLDTSGSVEVTSDVLDYTDLVVLDVKAIDADQYKDLVGLSNANFCKFVKLCQEKNKKMWLRQVVVPNYNDTKESVEQLKEFAKTLKNVDKIELLPYHTMAVKKYQQLGIAYRLQGVADMDKEKCKQLEQFLK